MDLPFQTKPKPETHIVGTATTGTIELPKLYTVTPNEEVAISESLRKAGSGNDIVALKCCHCEIAALGLQRKPKTEDFDPAEVKPEFMRELPGDLVSDLFSYMMKERHAWKEPDPTDEGSEKNLTGASTSKDSESPSPTTTTDSAPAGQADTTTKASATSRSAKSAKATKQTSK